MRLIYHPDEHMFTCFGTIEEHDAQREWWEELSDDYFLEFGSYQPFSRDKVLWHVWDTFGDPATLKLYKLTWGGQQ